MKNHPRKVFMFTSSGKKWRGAYLVALLAVFLQVLAPVGQAFSSSIFTDDATENWQPLVICASFGGPAQISATDITNSGTPGNPSSQIFTADCAVCQLRSLSGSLLFVSSVAYSTRKVVTHQKDFLLTADPVIISWRINKSPRAPPVVS